LAGETSLPGGTHRGAGRGQPQGERVMNEDQVKGWAKQAGGKIKEITGKVIGNERLIDDGQIEMELGKTLSDYGDRKELRRMGKA
jgi:uncharacterized protein YjbJ (UPF0337 family)